MGSTRVTLRQLLQAAGGCLEVPAYQRRYVWGQVRPGEKDAAAYLVECLLQASASGQDYFLQGVTIVDGSPCQLVDGQQRITFLYLLLKYLGSDASFDISYQCRPAAQAWLQSLQAGGTREEDLVEDPGDIQDIHYFKKTLRTLRQTLPCDEGRARGLKPEFILDHVYFLCIRLESQAQAVASFKMMNGTKMPMQASDLIKADLMRMASDPAQPYASRWQLDALRARYAAEWESWCRWWNREAVASYYEDRGDEPLSLLLRLCLNAGPELSRPVTYEEFRQAMASDGQHPWHAAKHFFYKLRRAQKKFEEAYDDANAYNRIRAILLLQPQQARLEFLKRYFVDMAIDDGQLLNCYKLSFLGMEYVEIERGDDPAARFDDLLVTLGMADIYHTEAKREAFNLLLRLNIDEDIKLNRKFDFAIWHNRSLEHIYSKSKVWHLGPRGETLDGNDNPLQASPSRLEQDGSFLPRAAIVNRDGMQLSEHCIGNLVLLYGQNNAAFGNADFEGKKMMFLTPSSQGVFQSRNLLHSVCVFAGNSWTAESIVDNYNLTLKNLKIYYGYK